MAKSRASSYPLFGWIGLGNMGLAMGTNLQKYLNDLEAPPLHYSNRTMARGEPLQALGACPSDSVEELVSNSDIVFISLADDYAVFDIVDKIASQNPLNSKIVIDTSTISATTTKQINNKLAEAGASLISAPVFGVTPVAVRGQLLMAMAGPQGAIDKVKPYISACMARAVIVMGSDPAQATLLKTTGNFITAAMAETVAEAHVLAEKAGLANEVLHQMINKNYGAYMSSISDKVINGVYAPAKGQRARSNLTLAIKDVSHGIDAAKGVDTRLKIAELTWSIYRKRRSGPKKRTGRSIALLSTALSDSRRA